MKRTLKSLFILFIVVFFLSTAFSIRDPKPDYSTAKVELNSLVHLLDIATENEVDGFFKSSIDFALTDFDTDVKGFYGQEIKLVNNASVDRIRIGVKTNLIARVELWKGSDCIAVEELGFMKKMIWGETYTMEVVFQDQTNERFKGESRISMAFFDGTRFFGDTGGVSIDLTGFGDMSGDKTVGVFADPSEASGSMGFAFSNWEIRKDFRSFD